MTAPSAADLAATVRDYFVCTPLTPNERLAIAALDALLARCQEAEHRAKGWVQHDTQAYADATSRAIARAEAAEARVAELEQALREIDHIFDLVVESDRRCTHLRVELITGRVDDWDAASEYATATAPLASAARRITDGRARAALQSGGSDSR